MAKKKTVLLDDHGQPVNRLYGFKRLNDRSADELIGLCKGIIADGEVNLSEAAFLRIWLEDNKPYIKDPLINALYHHVYEMLNDGVYDKQEQQELLQILTEFTGESSIDLPEPESSSFPLNKPCPETVLFPGMKFCLTGKFVYGTRKICEESTKALGASTSKGVTLDTNYLVIGTFCSKDWIHTSYGRKIEKAVEYRDERKTGIQIIHEDVWAKHLL